MVPLISVVHYLKLQKGGKQVPIISDVHYLTLPGRRSSSLSSQMSLLETTRKEGAGPSHLRCLYMRGNCSPPSWWFKVRNI